MKKAIFILPFFITFIAQSQYLNKNSFVGKWKLNWSESGFFPKENLLFEKTNNELTDYIFKFNNDGSISYKADFGECPVGVFTLKDGNWNFENGFLTLELRGEKIADYWYWWIIKYNVEFIHNIMKLTVIELIKNHQLSADKTWEELINN